MLRQLRFLGPRGIQLCAQRILLLGRRPQLPELLLRGVPLDPCRRQGLLDLSACLHGLVELLLEEGSTSLCDSAPLPLCSERQCKCFQILTLAQQSHRRSVQGIFVMLPRGVELPVQACTRCFASLDAALQLLRAVPAGAEDCVDLPLAPGARRCRHLVGESRCPAQLRLGALAAAKVRPQLFCLPGQTRGACPLTSQDGLL